MENLTEIFSYICGRNRCFVIDGAALPVCQRCLGLYTGAFFTLVWLILTRTCRRGLSSRSITLLHIAMILTAMAGGIHLLDTGPRWRLLCGLWTGHVITLWLLGDALWELTRDLDIQAIGGLEVGAIPMATAAALRYHQEGRHLEAFFVRKQAKGHGSQERLEGIVRPGFRVAVVDDVLTSGGSVEQAIAEIEKVGAKVAVVSCIVDRLEGARERLARHEYRPIFTIRDFGIEPPG